MPDSNGDDPQTPPGSAPAPEPPARPASSRNRPAPLPPAPRANPPSIHNPKDAPAPVPPAAPAGFSDFITWMQTFSAAPPPVPPPAAAPEARTLLPKDQKKFHRFDPEVSRADQPPATPGDESGESADADSGTARRTPRPPLSDPAPEPGPVKRRRRPKPTVAPDEPSFRIPWRLLFLVGLLTGSFYFGRKTAFDAAAQTAVPPPSRQKLERGADQELFAGLFDQAMAASAGGDYARAASLLQQARKQGSRTAGIDYQLALLAFKSGDFPRAMGLLNQSVDAGEEMAASYDLRGLLNNRTAGIDRGLGDLEAATRIDPFSARYFYFLGEALRRNGKPQAALTCLLHAVDRLQETELESLYRLKVRLAQIELGQENEFAGQLTAELQRDPPSTEWLLTAAAVELHAGRLDAAAGFLDRFVALADERTVNSRLRDYFFFSFANEKSLARFYAGIHKADAAMKSAHGPASSPTPVAASGKEPPPPSPAASPAP